MLALRLTQAYLVWHYTSGFLELGRIMFELWRFLYRFFSLPVLFRRPFSLSALPVVSGFAFSGFVIFFGFCLRVILGLLGLVVLFFSFLLWPIAFLFWFLVPVLIVVFWFTGFYLLFHL